MFDVTNLEDSVVVFLFEEYFLVLTLTLVFDVVSRKMQLVKCLNFYPPIIVTLVFDFVGREEGETCEAGSSLLRC